MHFKGKARGREVVLAGILAVCITAALFFRPVGGNRAPASVEGPEIPVPDAERWQRLSESPRASLPWPAKLSAPKRCRNAWDSVLRLDLAELVEVPPRENLLPGLDGCPAPSPEIERAQSEAIEACAEVRRWRKRRSGKTSWLVASRRCTGALVSLRANLVDWQTGFAAPEAIGDLRTLTDKVIAQMAQDPRGAVPYAERLLAREPKMYPAWKALLVGRLAEARAAGLGQPDHPAWQSVLTVVQRASELNPGDRKQLLETELAVTVLRHGDPRPARERAKALSTAYPKLGVGPYYLAWIAFKEGDRAAAESLARDALAREPGERQFQETLARLTHQSADSAEPPFHTYLSFR